MTRRALFSFLGVCALTVFVVGLREDSNVRVTIEGGLQFEPATIRLRVRVEPDAANRGLAVGVESGEFLSSSWEDLHGEASPITRWFTYAALPAGEYVAAADVIRPGSENWQARTSFRVLERGF